MRSLTAIILLLWSVCFLHCSAEQFGMVDCDTCATSCESPECESEECPNSEDDTELPCGICDFLTLGGTPTISAVELAAFSDSEVDSNFTSFLGAALQGAPIADLNGESVGLNAAVQPCVPLYSKIAGKVLPARGPNV